MVWDIDNVLEDNDLNLYLALKADISVSEQRKDSHAKKLVEFSLWYKLI